MLKSNNLITHQLRVVATRCCDSTSLSVRRASRVPPRASYRSVVPAISRDLENATIVVYCLHTIHREAVGRNLAAPQAGASTNYIHALVSHASSFPFRHLTSTSLPTSMRSIVRCFLRSSLRLDSWRNTHPTHSFKCIAGGKSTLLVSSGKGLVQSGSTFRKGRRRRKGENERGRDRVPGKPRGCEGSRNGHNGKLDARHADRERGESRAVISKWM